MTGPADTTQHLPNDRLTLLWFRRDLRLTDNPALVRAMSTGAVIPVYIHAPEEDGDWRPGTASRWWLHRSLTALRQDLERRGSTLVIRHGPTLPCLQALLTETGAGHVCWNRLHEPAAAARDRAVENALQARGIAVAQFEATLLHAPGSVLTRGGDPYRVFTPFWRACRAMEAPFGVEPAPERIPAPRMMPPGLRPDALDLLPQRDLQVSLAGHWQPGEAHALACLQHFLEGTAAEYDALRDCIGPDTTSRLSPYLHFGEIGPRQVLAACRAAGPGGATDGFLRQLGWREFAHHLLYHFPHTPTCPLDGRFDAFPWARPEPRILQAWQQGMTGVPLVDAAMRSLRESGWMHNRARMVVASLLTKNLGIHWLEGARWFWDTLVDADLANNTLGWQWTAGCGADAAPYFRVFNPVLQGERFDSGGAYVRNWVPELAKVPARYIHRPWEAPPRVLEAAGVRLGNTYPRPAVDLSRSRRQALDRWAVIRGTR